MLLAPEKIVEQDVAMHPCHLVNGRVVLEKEQPHASEFLKTIKLLPKISRGLSVLADINYLPWISVTLGRLILNGNVSASTSTSLHILKDHPLIIN